MAALIMRREGSTVYGLPAVDARGRVAERRLLPTATAYLAAILVGLVWPPVAVAVYFALALCLVIPFHEIRRLSPTPDRPRRADS
jgi:hypothetical protein